MSGTERSEGKSRKSHWRSLAEALGMSVPQEPDAVPEEESGPACQASESEATDAAGATLESVPTPDRAEETRHAVSQSATTPPAGPTADQSRAKASAAARVRPPSDWYGLASQLGIPVEPPPPPEAVEPATPPEPVEESRTPRMRSVSPSKRTPQEAPRVEKPAEVVEFEEEEGEEVFELEVASLGNVDFGDDEAEAEQVVAVDRMAGEEDGGDEEESQSAAAENATRRRRRRGRRRSTSSDRDRERVASKKDETNGTTESAAEDDEPESAEADEPTDEPVTETRGRRPRRRRRRSARPEKHPVAGQEDDEQESDDDDEGESFQESDDDDPQSSKSTGGSRIKHHKIPTWEEAISVLVDSNTQSRSRGGGSPKSKPRGARRRRS